MRVVERILSLLVAAALVVGAVLLALEVGWAVAGQPPLLVPWRPAYTAGTRDAWDSAAAQLTAAIALAAGLLLLLVTLKPRRSPRLKLTSADPTVDAAITRRSLRAALLHSAKQVDGISSAKATVRKRKVTVKATSRLSTTATAKALTGELDGALRSRLEALQLARTPRLRTRVRPRRGARSA